MCAQRSAYGAALLARLVKSVVAVESDAALAAAADQALKHLGVGNVTQHVGKMEDGAAASAPYDVVVIEGAVRQVPQTILDQIDEAEGKEARVARPGDRDQEQGRLAALEPSFDLRLDGPAVEVTWQNIEGLNLRYYAMDVELLFSRNPFVQQFRGQFSAIRPNQSQDLQLPEGKKTLQAPLPESLSRTLGELRTERDLLGRVLDGMAEGVLVLDAQGTATVRRLDVHVDQPTAFVDSPRGDLVVLSRAGDVLRITGG